MSMLTPRPISLWLGPIETAVFASLLAFTSQLIVSLMIYREVMDMKHRVT